MLTVSRPCLLIRQRRAHRRRRAVADAVRALPADVLIVLVEIPQPHRPAADERLTSDTSDQSSFLICAHSSADSRAVLIGLASQPYAACSMSLLARPFRCLGQLRAALREGPLAIAA